MSVCLSVPGGLPFGQCPDPALWSFHKAPVSCTFERGLVDRTVYRLIGSSRCKKASKLMALYALCACQCHKLIMRHADSMLTACSLLPHQGIYCWSSDCWLHVFPLGCTRGGESSNWCKLSGFTELHSTVSVLSCGSLFDPEKGASSLIVPKTSAQMLLACDKTMKHTRIIKHTLKASPQRHRSS